MKTEKLTHVGNFVLYLVCDAPIYHLEVKSTSGQWMVSYRNDTSMYNMVMKLLEVGDADVLHGLLSYLFVSSQVVPDSEFFAEFSYSLERLYMRMPHSDMDDSDVDTERRMAEVVSGESSSD